MKKSTTTTPKQTRQHYTADTKAEARALYLRGLRIEEIGKFLNIPKKTLEKWQTADRWTDYKTETTEKEKRAYELRKAGKSANEIAHLFNTHKQTIYKWIRKYKNSNGTHQN